LRGASAAEEVLRQQKSDNMVVLAVWEPILPSDWTRPTRPVLGRISDKRVIQFWDKDHLVAEQLSAQLRPKEPACCRHSRTLWDLVALYPKEATWNGSEPVYIDGPVYKIKDELRSQTSKLLQAPNLQAFSSKGIRDKWEWSTVSLITSICSVPSSASRYSR
jgi:hypothetical protein